MSPASVHSALPYLSVALIHIHTVRRFVRPFCATFFLSHSLFRLAIRLCFHYIIIAEMTMEEIIIKFSRCWRAPGIEKNRR